MINDNISVRDSLHEHMNKLILQKRVLDKKIENLQKALLRFNGD